MQVSKSDHYTLLCVLITVRMIQLIVTVMRKGQDNKCEFASQGSIALTNSCRLLDLTKDHGTPQQRRHFLIKFRFRMSLQL